MKTLMTFVDEAKLKGDYDVKNGMCPHCGSTHYSCADNSVICNGCYSIVELFVEEICENSNKVKGYCGCYNCKMD